MKETIKADICIIGGGVIGASLARELSQYNKKIIVLESNARVAMETTAGNSGFVHGGFDPTPGKLNAILNVKGKKRYEDWIRDMQFPHVRINSTVAGFNDEEMKEIKKLYDRGLTNGLDPKELEIIDAKELQRREPRISKEAKGALICNSSIALDTVELTKTLFANAIKNDVKLFVNSKVDSIVKEGDKFILTTKNKQTFEASAIINAAGHYADVIASKAGYPDYQLTTRRGEYRILAQSENHDINSVLFMVPTIHGKGVLVAPTLDGRLMVGPTAHDSVPKADTLLITQASYNAIADIGRRIVPDLNMDRTVTSYSGSRPIYAKTDDFYIKTANNDPNFINVAGMKSPAIAAAPAIADYVIAEMVKPIFRDFDKKPNWDPIQKSYLSTN